MDITTLFIPESISVEKTIELEKDVTAMELVRKANGAARLGGIAVIPKGSSIEICGPGFNDRTHKARYKDRFFFVFRQDLDPVSEPVFSEQRPYFRDSPN